MASIGKINGIALASIGKINSRTLADNDKVIGIIKPATGSDEVYLNQGFQGLSRYGYGFSPTNWRTTSDTVYGSTAADRAWSSDIGGTTPSGATGPTNGHGGGYNASDGAEATSTPGDEYMHVEATNQFNKRFLMRTPELDFSNALANDTLKLHFWFHMYGSNMGNLGVAATDNSTSAGDDTLGKHFTSDTAGGLTMTYWDDASDDGSSTATGVRITGQQQTAGHGTATTAAHWRKATVDLNDLAGQSSVYIWFFSKSGAQFRSDCSIDDVAVVGQE